MATATHIPTFETPAANVAATRTGDPLVFGSPLIAAGAIALGLQLVGFVDVNSSGSPLPVLLAGSGIGLLLTSAWSASLRAAPASSPWSTGTTLPTTVLGALAAFFLSYAALVLGLVHGRLGVRPGEIQHTIALFQITWLVVFVLIGFSSVRLPAAFTALFVSSAAALVLLLISTLGPSTVAGKIAGIVVLLIGAAAGYVFLAVASRAGGGREHPIGRPIAR
jgi:succinate-acetate transporter protein